MDAKSVLCFFGEFQEDTVSKPTVRKATVLTAAAAIGATVAGVVYSHRLRARQNQEAGQDQGPPDAPGQDSDVPTGPRDRVDADSAYKGTPV